MATVSVVFQKGDMEKWQLLVPADEQQTFSSYGSRVAAERVERLTCHDDTLTLLGGTRREPDVILQYTSVSLPLSPSLCLPPILFLFLLNSFLFSLSLFPCRVLFSFSF